MVSGTGVEVFWQLSRILEDYTIETYPITKWRSLKFIKVKMENLFFLGHAISLKLSEMLGISNGLDMC